MPDHCSAFGCENGYGATLLDKGEDCKKISFFRIPKGELREVYGRRMKLGRPLTDTDRICSVHFHDSQIQWKRDDISLPGGVTIVGSPLKNPRLKPDAVPQIFPKCPSYMTSRHQSRPAPKQRQQFPTAGRSKVSLTSAQESQGTDANLPDSIQNERRQVSEAASRKLSFNIAQESQDNNVHLPHSKQSSRDGCNNLHHITLYDESDSRQPAPERDTEINQPKSVRDGLLEKVDVKSLKLPSKQWAVTEPSTDKKTYMIVKINERMRVSRGIILSGDKIEVEINERPLLGLAIDVSDQSSLEHLIQRLHCFKACLGYNGNHAVHCYGWLGSWRAQRCFACNRLKKREDMRELRMTKAQFNEKRLSSIIKKQKLQNLQRSVKRNRSKVKELRETLKSLKKECTEIETSKLLDLIKDLPQEQQDMILACQNRAKVNGATGVRYDLKWVYECILMRIKSPTLYEHIRTRKILPVPCRSTLNRYMRKLHPMYGFQESLFATLSKKINGLKPSQRHGNILIDEIKLQPGLEFDRHLLRYWGMVDLGRHTPEKLKGEMGDHALVIQFVPFSGKYTQVLSCFLSKGNVKGAELAKIVLEGVTLSENAGLLVDAVTCDGAGWNANMWSEFGVSAEKSYCTHPCDDQRKLWFISDWCHLLKCMRNCLCPLPYKKPKPRKRKAPADTAKTSGEGAQKKKTSAPQRKRAAPPATAASTAKRARIFLRPGVPQPQPAIPAAGINNATPTLQQKRAAPPATAAYAAKRARITLRPGVPQPQPAIPAAGINNATPTLQQKRAAPPATAANAAKRARIALRPGVPQPQPATPAAQTNNSTVGGDPKENFATKHLFKTLHTPDGLVQRQHWLCLWREEEKLQKKNLLRYAPKIDKKAVLPTGFQRMNVGMAFKFFDVQVAAAMETYRNKNVYGFKDSKPTQEFILKVYHLAKAMNSGSSKGALYKNCAEEKTIEDFLKYHQECIRLAKANGRPYFLSDLTDAGLTITLKSTLGLARYLRDEVGYTFVMTKRFNQDALEQFFGNIRRAAAPNPHPDPKLFAQLFRLLCMYSLVSPVKGSNVRGVSNLETLLNTEDVWGMEIKKRRQEFEDKLDEILIYGKPFDALEKATHHDHNYRNAPIDPQMNQFMAGFTAAKMKETVGHDCEHCIKTIIKTKEEANANDNFTLLKEQYGGYSLPTDSMALLIRALEVALALCADKEKMQADFVFQVLDYIDLKASCFVGCMIGDHMATVTKKIMSYYLITRMFFYGDQINAQFAKIKEEARDLRRKSKNLKEPEKKD